jgi:hypothetical protein
MGQCFLSVFTQLSRLNTNLISKPSMALISNRPGKSVVLPGLASAYALGGPSWPAYRFKFKTIRLNLNRYKPPISAKKPFPVSHEEFGSMQPRIPDPQGPRSFC